MSVAETTPIYVARERWGPRRLAGRLAGRPEREIFLKYGPLLVVLALLVLLARKWWAADLLTFPLLLVLPGVLLLRALRVPGTAVARSPVYVPAASLAVLMLSGLIVDLAGPLAGDAEPVRTVPLLIGVEASCVLLMLAGSRVTGHDIPWHSFVRPFRYSWPLLIPVAAAAGALRLNNGQSPTVAVAALCCAVAALVLVFLLASRLDTITLSVVLYAVSLAMLWSFSLRGALVYGYDISAEYHAMHQTVFYGTWSVSHPNDAYGAELSLTILPAMLHFLVGVSDLMVLKLLFPAIAAMFPVAVFGIARQLVDHRWAFIAASFIVVQSTFGQEFPALARQEIAMVLFVALLAALLDSGLIRPAQWTLTAVFAVGMAVSHYSTAYVAIGLILGLVILQLAVSGFRDIPRLSGVVAVALIAAVASSAVWNGVLTRSGSNVTTFGSTAVSLISRGTDFKPAQVISGYLHPNAGTTMSPAEYQSLAAAHYHTAFPFMRHFPDATGPAFAVRPAPEPDRPGRLVPVQHALSAGELGIEQLAELLAAAGAFVIALRRSTPRKIRLLALLAVVAVFALVLIRLVGSLAALYNQQRALLQALTILSIPLAWVLQSLASRFRSMRHATSVLAAAALTVLFVQMSSLTSALLKGGSPYANLANSGPDYEQFDMSTPELAAAFYLGQNVRHFQLVYYDRYGALRFAAEASVTQGLFTDVTPRTLDVNAWIYADRTNVIDGRARAVFDNRVVTYAFPVDFINGHYNRVYTNGSSEVFHG